MVFKNPLHKSTFSKRTFSLNEIRNPTVLFNAQKKLSKDILIVYYDYTRSLTDSFKRIDMFAESGFDFIQAPGKAEKM